MQECFWLCNAGLADSSAALCAGNRHREGLRAARQARRAGRA
jgi:hypothetical protein